MDVLQAINEQTSLNSLQLDILIQLDFFADFGNPNELLAIAAYFVTLNKGRLTRVSKDKVAENRLSGLIESAATDLGKKGVLKSWNITNMPLLLRNCEDHVKAQHLPPPKPSEYARAQMAFLGYTEPMGAAGKGLLYVVSDVRQLISKKNNKPWARSFSAVSLADGSNREWTIREQDYCDQFVKGDILRVIPETRSGKTVYTNSWGTKEYNGRT